MSLRPTALALLALLLAGCGGDPDPVPGPDGGAELRTQGKFAGTWRRTLEDGTDYVFEVIDDGQTVRGEMTEGLPEDCLSYVFDLERTEEEGVLGSSLVRFEEEDGGIPTNYSTQWRNAICDGEAVLVEQQWIETDEFGDVVKSGWTDVRYAFTPFVSEEELAAAWAEALAGLEAPHAVTVGPEAGMGMGVVQLTGQAENLTAWAWMLVDESDDAWHVEVSGGPLLEQPLLVDAVMGLTVHKESGHVTHAVVGKPGTAGTEIAISEQTMPRKPALEGTPEEITVEAGTFATEKVESRHGTSWVGTEGGAQGILVKWIGEDTEYELAQALEQSTVTLADGTTVDATLVRYSNGMQWTLTRHPIVRTFLPYDRGTTSGEWGFLGMVLPTPDGATTLLEEVIEVRDDASPQLRWN
jgi:hypothetical protein